MKREEFARENIEKIDEFIRAHRRQEQRTEDIQYQRALRIMIYTAYRIKLMLYQDEVKGLEETINEMKKKLEGRSDKDEMQVHKKGMQQRVRKLRYMHGKAKSKEISTEKEPGRKTGLFCIHKPRRVRYSEYQKMRRL